MSASRWERVDPPASPAADLGGERQVSEAWEARWTRQLRSGYTAVVTRFYYLADDGRRRYLEEQTEYLVGTNPDQPVDSEVWSGSAFDELPASGEPRQAAVDAREPSDEEWRKAAPEWLGDLC